MGSATRPWWQQATALVTVSAGGVITGLTFAPGAAAAMTSPTGLPVHLMALENAAHPAARAESSDTALRPAIVNVAKYYLQLARTRTPAQMAALIWGQDSVNGADHGESCAAFASLTLELGAQAVGQRSWVTGGTTYPWPVESWADARVDENPSSPGIVSIVQDATAHGRWHPLGDGYQPQPGDWVLFDQHVEVVTSYTHAVLDTIGGDSLPNYSVNAHTYSGSLAADGVAGFVDNGNLASASPAPAGTSEPVAQPAKSSADEASTGQASARGPATSGTTQGGTTQGGTTAAKPAARSPNPSGAEAAIPGLGAPSGAIAASAHAASSAPDAPVARTPSAGPAKPPSSTADIPGAAPLASGAAGTPGTRAPSGTRAAPASASGNSAIAGAVSVPARIPGAVPLADAPPASGGIPAETAPASSASPGTYHKSTRPSAPAPTTAAQQEFLNSVIPGAIAAQQRWGVPASVTIAQAIEESAWGSSQLATQAHNLFGIKGTGPAGSVTYQTQEYIGGQWETIDAAFRAYHNISESISDHARLLATSGYYVQAMVDRANPDAFANDLTGIYATDPNYGANLIAIMRLYDLYRYDFPAASAPSAPATRPASADAASPSSPAAPTPTRPAVPTRPAASRPSPDNTFNPTAPATTPSHAGLGRGATPVREATPMRGAARIPGTTAPTLSSYKAARYQTQMPAAVTTAFFTTAKTPLTHAEPMYREVASRAGISWKLLAACDWMQCQAHPRYSPVNGEKLGAVNPDGSVYLTKSEALARAATDMVELASAVYGIDLRIHEQMPVRSLAEVFAAFRWGGLLKKHGVSAMEFPYSVAGLTDYHTKMHWPRIAERDTPDKQGGKFKMPFGAVPVVLSLKYPATV